MAKPDIALEISLVENWLDYGDPPKSAMLLRCLPTIIAVARAATEGGWRTMESAPKNDTEIVLVDKYARASDVVHWRPPFVNYGMQIPGRFVNREGRGMDTRDYADWVFWTLAPALPATEPQSPNDARLSERQRQALVKILRAIEKESREALAVGMSAP